MNGAVDYGIDESSLPGSVAHRRTSSVLRNDM